MKRSNFSFKLLTIIIAFVTIGCFQLYGSQAQKNVTSLKVPVTIFSSAYKHIPGLEKDAKKIIKTVRKEFNLDDKGMNYHRVQIDVIDEDNDAEGDFLFVYFLLKDRYGSEISKITLMENYEVAWIENDYRPGKDETSTEWLSRDSCDCPDTSVEILLSTCCTSIPTAVAGIDYSYDAAVNAGYNTVKLLGSEENTTDIDKWLCCPNLIYWGRIGHGSSSGIYLDDGILSYTYFNSLPAGALQGKTLYFNSCQVFNDPLKSSILNKDAYKFIGGICNLLIGPSEEVFKCWNDNDFYQVPPPGGEPDEMCYWSTECESSTGYPYPGCHGCGGPGLIFPEPGGFNEEDLVVRTSDARLLLFPFENGIFTGSGKQVGHGWNFTHYLVGDWNNDYDTQDLIVRNSSGTMRLYPYRNETFYTYGSIQVGQNFNYTHYFVGNWTNNGTDDLIVRDSNGYLWLLPYVEDVGFGSGTSLGGGWNFTHYFIGNWSGNGTPDLIVRDSYGYMWFFKFNNGTFSPAKRVGNGWYFTDYFVGNWTGDGTDDLIVRDSSGNMRLYPFRNESFYGISGSGKTVATGWYFTDYFVGDWKNNGTDDMIVRESNGNLKLYPFENEIFGSGTTAGTGFNYTHYLVGQWTDE
jgi:hypothetical protein